MSLEEVLMQRVPGIEEVDQSVTSYKVIANIDFPSFLKDHSMFGIANTSCSSRSSKGVKHIAQASKGQEKCDIISKQ